MLKQRIALFAAALWWGSLTAIGFLVVPMLFANLPSPAMAGTMAGRLFSVQTWVSVACGMLLLFEVRAMAEGRLDNAAQTTLMLVAAGLLLALLQEFAVAPRILARENLKLWHLLGSAMYLVQWLLAACVLWRRDAARARGSVLP